MAQLQTMPEIHIDQARLREFGERWQKLGQRLSRTAPESSSQLGELVDHAVAAALAELLGGISIVPLSVNNRLLVPKEPDSVEVGPFLVIGGVRPQHFDVGYRPDGVRFAFDSKTLNDAKSVAKNWQNMVNDLATEATTVHTRFPNAIVAFMVVFPSPCISGNRLSVVIDTLERITGRTEFDDPDFRAEAISFVIWNPEDGSIDTSIPGPQSLLRLERFSAQVDAVYHERYKGLPPHVS